MQRSKHLTIFIFFGILLYCEPTHGSSAPNDSSQSLYSNPKSPIAKLIAQARGQTSLGQNSQKTIDPNRQLTFAVQTTWTLQSNRVQKRRALQNSRLQQENPTQNTASCAASAQPSGYLPHISPQTSKTLQERPLGLKKLSVAPHSQNQSDVQ